MELSEDGLKLIEGCEGLSLKLYKDTGGIPTIGYGHTGSNLPSEITQDEAEDYLRKDVEVASTMVDTLVDVPLNQNQFDALVCFVFNVGAGAFRKSTMLRLLNAHSYDSAAGEFLRWVRVAGVVSKGLTARRTKEKILFETPISE